MTVSIQGNVIGNQDFVRPLRRDLQNLIEKGEWLTAGAVGVSFVAFIGGCMRIVLALALAACSSTTFAQRYRCDNAQTAERKWQEIPCDKGWIERVFDGDMGRPSKESLYGKRGEFWVTAGFPSADSAEQCVDDWRPLLKDPASAIVAPADVPAVVMESTAERHIIVEGRARNGFGAFGVQYFVCAINLDGSIVRGSGAKLKGKADDLERYGVRIAYPMATSKRN